MKKRREKTHGHRQQSGDYQSWGKGLRVGEVEEGTGGINGDGWRLDLGW